MAETLNLGLPLLASAQAQKHVTVNEALVRLDALAAATVESLDLAAPPASPPEGAAYIVAALATAEWVGREGQVAIRSNGGWSFAAPRPGFCAWIADRSERYVLAGDSWVPAPIGPERSGAFTFGGLISGEAPIVAGAGFDADLAIPDRAIVLGVTARVLSAVSGPGLTGWRIGVSGAADRYGTSIGISPGSSLIGPSGSPLAYYEATPLRIEPEGGLFEAGLIRVAIHFLGLVPPAIV